MHTNAEEIEDFRQFVNRLSTSFYEDVERRLSATFLGAQTQEVRAIRQAIEGYFNYHATNLAPKTNANPTLVELDDVFVPLICRAILHERKVVAKRIEEPRQSATSQEILDQLQAQLLHVDRFLEKPWFSKTKALNLPRIADYLTVQESERTSQHQMAPREYDEKFHILMAPSLFHKDLDHFREKCGIRNASISVGYVDIDDFKKFNTKYTEPYIDRNLLPRLMQIIEGHVYSHGYAYRYGGDEYVFLLPNTTNGFCSSFFAELQDKIKTTSFPGIEIGPTLSIGVFSFDPDSVLTGREIEEKANSLKNEAKTAGKDRVVVDHE